LLDFHMGRIGQLIDDLNDSPTEALVVALTDAIFLLENGTETRMSLCMAETDAILERLRAHGYDVVPTWRRFNK
jgi:hypothetical protein